MSQPACILIVDNDDAVVTAIATRLEHAGYTCVTASTGAQALSVFDGSVDLVISDLNMPGGDGITLARSLRETSPVPIIFVTGFRDDFRRELRQIADVSLLRKPFDAADLIDLVETELALHRNAA